MKSCKKIRTHFQFGKSGSDYMRLVHPAGVEPVAFRVGGMLG